MRILTPLLLITIILFSCRKEPKNNYPQNSLTLTKTILSDGRTKYEWPLVNTDDFIEYVFYVSNFPIDDVHENGSVGAAELFKSSKKLNNVFIDSVGATFDQKYIKVIARLENSTLSSATLVNENVKFFPRSSNTSTTTIPVPSEKKIIILTYSSNSNAKASLLNYETKELEVENLELSGSYSGYKLGLYNNEQVIYNHNWNQLDIYSVKNLELVSSMALAIPNYIAQLSNVYLKNNTLCFRGSNTSSYYLYSYDLSANQLADSFNNGVFNTPPVVRQSNPSYLAYIDNSTNQTAIYTVNNNGELQYYNTLAHGGKYLGNSIMTEGHRSYLVTSQAKVYDDNLQLINNFNSVTNNFNYFQGASPNMQYYVFKHSSTGQPDVIVYKDGQQDFYQQRKFPINPTDVFPDNDEVIFLFKKTIAGQLGYLLIKTPLEP